MKSRSRHHRSKWSHCNTPEAKRRRRAANDARREAIASTLPPAYAGPDPLSRWQSVVVLDAHGEVMHRIDLYVPAGSARCDQHAGMVDGRRVPMVTATEIGAKVRGWIAKRPSLALVADIRRDEYQAAASML